MLYGAFEGNRCARLYMVGTQEKEQALTYRGVLSVGGMVYSAQKMVSPH